ncbi:sulfite exporter TauE/SafE family protein [Paenibacillus xanthanilyticus]|uniref:Probable membrane transporter protein n=1 Tax=Paenibacillus xanthanilyticus TaxID=1783531 RepID=A0ABV8KBG6_9BACL
MHADVGWLLMLFAIGWAGAFLSGLAGIGGSIVNFPLLLYVPPALGYAAFSAHEVSAIGAVQVLFATLSGALAYRRSGLIHGRLVRYMGVPVTLSGLAGSYGSSFVPESGIRVAYALLALAAAVMMLMPKRNIELADGAPPEFHTGLAAGSASVIGLMSGIVGAGGAFILLPVLLVLLRIPTRVAVASSLAITFLSSAGSTAGKALGGHMLLVPSMVMVAASLVGSPMGARVGRRLKVGWLQGMLAVLITLTALKIWLDILLQR